MNDYGSQDDEQVDWVEDSAKYELSPDRIAKIDPHSRSQVRSSTIIRQHLEGDLGVKQCANTCQVVSA